MKQYRPVNLSDASTFPIEQRPTKVNKKDLVQLCEPQPTLATFLDSLPHVLKANELRGAVDAIVEAKHREKPVVIGMGGHVIKCGLAPLLICLMERGIIAGIAMNGGASIHDFELATIGRTSEDVESSLEEGRFGMVRETGVAMNQAIKSGAENQIGMGEALGRTLIESNAPHLHHSVLAAGVRLGVPVMVHVAVGGDTIHSHPDADGAAIGATSLTDFRLLSAILGDFNDGGVYLNIGSAVVMPEVFLKALNLARNLADHPIANFTTINMDMQEHYRTNVNVLRRPTSLGGNAYSLTGHHEIMAPLVFNLVLGRLSDGVCGVVE